MKKCQFCGAELPDEASFCLQCSSVINTREVSASDKKKTLFTYKYKKAFAVCLAIFFIFTISIISVYRIKKLPLKPQNTNAPETVLVPVTQENGEAVTDSEGETVYEAVTVEPTTKKPSFISEIINSIKDKDKDKDENKDKNDNTVSNSGSDISQKPSSTENNTGNSSKEPSTDNNNVTSPTQSQAPTETEPTTEEEIIQEDPAEVFEFATYTQNKSYLSITKYKGNAEHVLIPSSYNGQYIVQIKKDAFKDNDKVKIISIDDNRPYLWLDSDCFYNCSNLHTINMPDVNLGIINNFARYCYAMKTIILKNNQFRFENGGLYYNNGRQWQLRYCCPAAMSDTLTLPLWCAGIEGACNLSELSKIKVINCHEYVSVFPGQTNLPENLEAIYVDDKNTKGYDVNGIAFALNSDGKYYCTYPPQNTTKDFTLPNNSFLYSTWLKNPYLEILRIEDTAEFVSPTYIACKWTFKNLKTIYIKSGHKNEADIKKEFYGTVYTF